MTQRRRGEEGSDRPELEGSAARPHGQVFLQVELDLEEAILLGVRSIQEKLPEAEILRRALVAWLDRASEPPPKKGPV